MRILVSWLREFVDVRLPAAELASCLSMRGFEVAAVEPAPDGPLAPEPGPPDPAASPADAVIDFEITANRPDCLSVIGLAREAATACRLPLRLPWDEAGRPISTVRPVSEAGPPAVAIPGLEVTIEDPDLCPRYAAALAEVAIAPSPTWLANRLEAAAVRPINNVVDVTNLVLLELGHPMHAFDVDRLAGRRLCARRARAGERVRTLDGEARTLEAGMLVIADAQVPQAVAGVMGGAASEVWAGTRLVAFESAYFTPTTVRRTSKRLGLKTEASSRFERGADINAAVAAIERAGALLQRIGAGRLVGPIADAYPTPRGPRTVPLRRHRIAHLLGITVPDEEVLRIFRGLGFSVAPTDDGWTVEIPTMRVDIAREADLIEEVARHHGYERVPATFPVLRSMPPRPDPRMARVSLLRHVLTAAGFSEAISYSFIEAAAATPFAPGGTADDLVALAYPLSEKLAVMRPSLVPGLVDAVATNRRRDRPDVQLFEVGACFSARGGEHRRLGLVWSGAGAPEHWSGGSRPVDLYHMTGVIEQMGAALRTRLDLVPSDCPYLAEPQQAAILAAGSRIGEVGLLSRDIARNRDLEGTEVYVAEIDLDAIDRIAPTADVRSEPLPRFPSIIRDISIVIDEGLRSERVRETIRRAAPETLVRVREFDRYQGQGIPEGRCSLSLRLTFRAADRTLTDAEVQQAMDRVVAALAGEHQAIQR